MKQFKKPLKLYLGRTLEGVDNFSNYQIATRRGDWDDADGFDASFIASFCGADFERVTGIRLERGEVLKVQILIDDL